LILSVRRFVAGMAGNGSVDRSTEPGRSELSTSYRVREMAAFLCETGKNVNAESGRQETSTDYTDYAEQKAEGSRQKESRKGRDKTAHLQWPN
jgi:hypothetical protein